MSNTEAPSAPGSAEGPSAGAPPPSADSGGGGEKTKDEDVIDAEFEVRE